MNNKEIILKYLKENAYLMCRKATGVLKYDFLDPGANYGGTLWDWDSCYSAEALIELTEKLKGSDGFDYEEKKAKVISCAKGSVLNFLDWQQEDGYIPVCLYSAGRDVYFLTERHRQGLKNNQVKPIICQSIENVSEYCGDYTWFDLDKVKKYFEYYFLSQFDERSGLFVWQNDLMVGVDNNPTVFYRSQKSSADIFLNSLMAKELECFVNILNKLGKTDEAEVFDERRLDLCNSLNLNCFDRRDAIYYSQDVQIDRTMEELGFHVNAPINYYGLPLKIRLWAGLLPLFAGVPNEEKAKALVKNIEDEDMFCEFGIRSLARNEKMYNEQPTNNPSNWQGPVWIIANYLIAKGFARYGYKKEADYIFSKTVELLANSIIESEGMYESYTASGEPMLFKGFLSWNCLAVKMI